MNMSRIRKQRISRPISRLISVADYVEEWYHTYKFASHEITTRDIMTRIINVHIRPSDLGNMTLQSVKTVHIQIYLTNLLMNGNKSLAKCGQPLAACTVAKIRALLYSAFKQAYIDHTISENYVEKTEKIKIKPKTIRFYTSAQQQDVLKAMSKWRYCLAYKLLFYTGCRRSEILGLGWDDVYFEDSAIHIGPTLILVKNKPILKPRPKNPSSLRTLVIHPDLMQELKLLKKKHELEKLNNTNYANKHNLVFVTKTGDPYNPQYLLKYLKNLNKKLNLPVELGIHSIRKTVATRLAQGGISLVDIQKIGGWKKPDTLLLLYAAAVPKAQIKALHDLYTTGKDNSTDKTKPKKKKLS